MLLDAVMASNGGDYRMLLLIWCTGSCCYGPEMWCELVWRCDAGWGQLLSCGYAINTRAVVCSKHLDTVVTLPGN